MDKYCLYLRKSRADMELEQRGEYETLARHEALLIELSRKLNINITKIYKEIVSGETIAARPVMQELLQDVENGLWTGVLVMEVERLARGDTIDQGIMAQAFKYSNTKIITPSKTYDPNNEFDEEYFEFGLFMSRREYKTINRRIQRGRTASAKEGKFLGSVAPYGYIKVKINNDKGYTLEPHPEQADVVKLIYELYVNGELQVDGTKQRLGATLIAEKLDNLNLKPLNNNTWSTTSIRDILKNPVYTGKIRWSYRKEIKKVIDGVVTITRPDNKTNDYLLVDGLHPALISEDLFNRAQEIMQGRVHAPVRNDMILQNPLTGLVYCKKCKSLMTRLAPNKRNKYSTLKCPNRNCDNVSAPIFLIEEKILSELSIFLEQYRLDIESRVDDYNPLSLKVKEKGLSNLKDEIATVNKQIENTYDLLEQGIYTSEVFISRNKSLNERLIELNNNLESAKKSYEQEMKLEQSKNKIIPNIERVLELYNTFETAADKNELLKIILVKIEYLKDTPNTRGKLLNDNFKITLFPKLPKS